MYLRYRTDFFKRRVKQRNKETSKILETQGFPMRALNHCQTAVQRKYILTSNFIAFSKTNLNIEKETNQTTLESRNYLKPIIKA